MTNNVAPGNRAVIINTVNGQNGKTYGRIVRVLSHNPENPNSGRGEGDQGWADLHNGLNDPRHYCPETPYEKHHEVYGLIWPCECIDGGTFEDNQGRIQRIIDVPDRWLEKLPDEKTDKKQDTGLELKVD